MEISVNRYSRGSAEPVSDSNPLPVRLIEDSTSAAAFTGSETLTVSTTALPLTAPKYGSATQALITVETEAIRFWLSGQAPTATTGHAVEPNNAIELTSRAQIEGFRVIRRDSADSTIQVSYGRKG